LLYIWLIGAALASAGAGQTRQRYELNPEDRRRKAVFFRARGFAPCMQGAAPRPHKTGERSSRIFHFFKYSGKKKRINTKEVRFYFVILQTGTNQRLTKRKTYENKL
jgi:hypothetical protein